VADGDGSMDLLGSQFKLTDTDLPEFRAPPRLGEHTDDVLASVLAMDAAGIEELRRDGVVA